MGLLDEDPSKLLRPADDGRQWSTPYMAMPRAAPPVPPGTLPPAGPNGINPGMPGMNNPALNQQFVPAAGPRGINPGMPPAAVGPQSANEDPRQTILALFKRFGLT